MNYQEAIRAMTTTVNAALLPFVTQARIIYPNTATPVPTDGSVSWARVTIKHVSGEQRSVPQENQHTNSMGTLIIQLFQPSGVGLGSNTSIAPILKSLRRAAVGSLFFKNVTSEEIGVDGHWFQTNISAIFDYHTIDP